MINYAFSNLKGRKYMVISPLVSLNKIANKVIDSELKEVKKTLHQEPFSRCQNVDELVGMLVEKILNAIKNELAEDKQLMASLPEKPEQLLSDKVLTKVNTTLEALSSQPGMPKYLKDSRFLITNLTRNH